MDRENRLRWSVGLIVVPGIALACFLLVRGAHDPERPLISVAASQPIAVELPAPSDRSIVAVNEAPTEVHRRTVRDYLKDYYGDDWASQEAEFEKRQKALLDRPLDEVEQIRPWEEVADQIRDEVLWNVESIEMRAEAALEWDPNLDLSWENIAKVFPNAPANMGERQLLEFQGLARDLNAPIRELALQQNAALADALACKWAANDFVRKPYSVPWITADPKRGNCVLATATASKTAWCVHTFVYAGEVPAGFEANAKKIPQMVEARAGSLSKYLDSFK